MKEGERGRMDEEGRKGETLRLREGMETEVRERENEKKKTKLRRQWMKEGEMEGGEGGNTEVETKEERLGVGKK